MLVQSNTSSIVKKGAISMSTEDNRARVRRLTEEGWNLGNSDVRDDVIATDDVVHEPSMMVQGHEGFRQFVSQYHSAFPDIHFTIEDMIAVGDKVVVRWSVTGTRED
jgi:predicted ester cyclase